MHPVTGAGCDFFEREYWGEKIKLGMLNSVFSCNRSSTVQNRILTEARSIQVDAHHAMSSESAA